MYGLTEQYNSAPIIQLSLLEIVDSLITVRVFHHSI